MKIVKDFTSNKASGNAYVIDESDVALINPTINNPAKNGVRILPGGTKNVWVVGANVTSANPDNITIHRGGAGGEDVSYIHVIGCNSTGATEESYDCTVGHHHYFIDCDGETMNIGHTASDVVLWNCHLKQVKIKASQRVYLIGGKIDNLIFEKQGTQGTGVGAGEGPESVFNFGCVVGSKKFNDYASAYQEISFNPIPLPMPPAEILADVEKYSPTYAGWFPVDDEPEPPIEDPNPPTDPEEPTPTDPKYTEMLEIVSHIETLLNQAFEELNVIKTTLNEYL